MCLVCPVLLSVYTVLYVLFYEQINGMEWNGMHNDSSNAPYGAVRRRAAPICCSNRSRFDLCRAARRRTARSENAAPILHAFDYGVYAPYGAVRRRTALHGAVRRRAARSVNAP